MDREALLEPIIASIRKGTSLSRYQILDELKDWEVLPLSIADKHVATAILKGTEIHFALVPGWRPQVCYRGAFHAFFRPLFERRGFLTTRIQYGRSAQKKFIQRVGFEPTWKDTSAEYFMLGSMPFERK